MIRRLLGDVCIGLGNPNPDIFDNKWTNNERFNELVREFFVKCLRNFDDIENGFDFSIVLGRDYFLINFGIDPSYKFDPYIEFSFSSDKEESYIVLGEATGYYGSDIVINEYISWDEMN